MNDRAFTRKLASVLTHNSIHRPRDREKSGLVDNKRIGKYGTTERVFSKRAEESLERNYSIEILVDSSGSMSGAKCREAFSVIDSLSKCLEQIDGIDFQISSFSDTDFIIKPYSSDYDAEEFYWLYIEAMPSFRFSGMKKGTDYTEAIGSDREAELKREGYELITYGNMLGLGNIDSLAVYRGYQRLLKRKGKKILLVFSDGQPARGYNISSILRGEKIKTIRGSVGERNSVSLEDDGENLKRVMAIIKREGLVVPIGVGIQSNAVEEYYPHNVVVDNLSDFFSETVRLLSREFKKVQ